MFIFVDKIKWHHNILEPERLELAFKTLWSLGLAIEEIKMSRDRKENANLVVSQSLAFTIRQPSNLIIQQSPIILGLCLRKTRSLKSYDYRDDIEKLRLQSLQNVLRPAH